MFRLFSRLLATGLLLAGTAQAADPSSCNPVRFSDVGWTDITVTTATTRLMLDRLGYRTQVSRMTVPQTYQALAAGRIDVFLGNWMPSMEADIRPYRDTGAVETVAANLEGAKYTLAVNSQAYEGGLRTFADLSRFRDRLDGKLYGIEPGNDGNELIRRMIDDQAFGLGDFVLVESSENGLLGQVLNAQQLDRWIAFLAWEPHPMNTRFDIRYLEGGDEYFGPNLGGATVFTNVRKGYLSECPNAGRLIANLRFSLDMENRLMDEVLSGRKNRRQAAKDWIAANPDAVRGWLQGVRSVDGRPGAEVVLQGLAD